MGLSPTYTTQGTFPALRRALVDDFPTISLLDPFIVIDFIVIYFIKNEFIDLLLLTFCITSANNFEHVNTLIFFLMSFSGE
jgi:hypothetical protein